MFLNGFVTIALLAAVAMATRTPFVFPSLGPTAFLFFVTPASTRRHTAAHHLRSRHRYSVRLWRAVALWLAACATGHDNRRLDGPRRRRCAVARIDRRVDGPVQGRPPTGGATTLIISLGIVTRPFHLLVIEVAVAILTCRPS
jgi:hypothetical protein